MPIRKAAYIIRDIFYEDGYGRFEICTDSETIEKVVEKFEGIWKVSNKGSMWRTVVTDARYDVDEVIADLKVALDEHYEAKENGTDIAGSWNTDSD